MTLLVAVDLDGTLLRSDLTVSPRTRHALTLAVRAGARVVAVTARPPRFTKVLAGQAGLGGTAICSNGAIVYDLDTEATHVLGSLPVPSARRAADTLRQVLPGVAFAVETGDRAILGPDYQHVSRGETAWLRAETHSELWSLARPLVKLLARSPVPVTDGVLTEITALLPELDVTYSGGRGLVEISVGGMTKATTLRRLCSDWGIGADQVIAFGDMPNDLSVLAWAGTSVAVANAHPRVLACVDRVTSGNDDDGVALVLEEVFGSDQSVVPTS